MTTIIGLDPGAHAMKARISNKGILLPSTVSVDNGRHISDESGQISKQRPMQIETKAGNFFVGQGAHSYGSPVENLDFDRLSGTPEMRALVYGTLSRLYPPDADAFTEPIKLIVGLPLKFVTGEAGDKNKAGVKAFLRGKHEWRANGKPYNVMLEPLITNQPLGALTEFLLNDEGHDRQPGVKSTDEFGVITIGRSTTEMLVFKNQQIQEGLTFGEQIGTGDLLALLDPERLYTIAEMDERLRDGAVKLDGHLDTFASGIMGHINRHWKSSWRRFERVILSSGGYLLLKEKLLLKFGSKAYASSDPVMGTAIGLYRMGVERFRSELEATVTR